MQSLVSLWSACWGSYWGHKINLCPHFLLVWILGLDDFVCVQNVVSKLWLKKLMCVVWYLVSTFEPLMKIAYLMSFSYCMPLKRSAKICSLKRERHGGSCWNLLQWKMMWFGFTFTRCIAAFLGWGTYPGQEDLVTRRSTNLLVSDLNSCVGNQDLIGIRGKIFLSFCSRGLLILLIKGVYDLFGDYC